MSNGALTQLAAIGAQDYNFLSSKAEDSVFTEPDKKINNFVKSTISMQPSGTSNWGTTTKFKIEKAIVKSHNDGVFNALLSVNEYSLWLDSSDDCSDKFDFPSGRRPMSSGCRLTNIIDMGHTNMIPDIPKIIQVDSHE